MDKTKIDVTESLARKVLETVDAGLVNGFGNPVPGQMCVEAAVCYAMDLPHSDRPTCVGDSVRAFKIRLNDASWSSNQARTNGMRKLAIAQLGSNEVDQKAFRRIVAEQTVRQIVPIALRAASRRIPAHAERLEAAAVRCENDGTREAAMAARNAARDVYAYDAAEVAAYAYDAADADAYDDADVDAYAAAYAAAAAAAYAYADAAADAAAARDAVLTRSAEIGLAALIELKSPGCAYLWLCDGAQP
jgi:hypothetical protein